MHYNHMTVLYVPIHSKHFTHIIMLYIVISYVLDNYIHIRTYIATYMDTTTSSLFNLIESNVHILLTGVISYTTHVRNYIATCDGQY